MSKKAAKKFDCLRFKDEAQAKVAEEIGRLTVAEQVAYFRKRAESGPFGSWLRKATKATGQKVTSAIR
jgi:hypothetical protein